MIKIVSGAHGMENLQCRLFNISRHNYLAKIWTNVWRLLLWNTFICYLWCYM